QTRGGAAYLSVELQDRTGTIAGRLWLGSAAFFGSTPATPAETGSLLVERLRAALFVHAAGTVKRGESNESGERDRPFERSFADELHIELSSIVPASGELSDLDVRELYEHTPADTESLIAELRQTFETEVEDAWVRRLLLDFLDDPALAAKLKKA